MSYKKDSIIKEKDKIIDYTKIGAYLGASASILYGMINNFSVSQIFSLAIFQSIALGLSAAGISTMEVLDNNKKETYFDNIVYRKEDEYKISGEIKKEDDDLIL